MQIAVWLPADRQDGSECGNAAFEHDETLRTIDFTLDRYVKVYREDIRDAVHRSDLRAGATALVER